MNIKSAPLRAKAVGEDDGLVEGQFLAYASVFGNVDSYGDIVDPGAFAKSLAEWEEKGDPIPLLWGHDMVDPFANIGRIVKAEEDDHGLKVLGEFDLDNPTAQQVYRLVKGRRTTDLSFAYEIRDSEKGNDALHLKDLGIFEVSIVPIGANRLTDVVAVKHLAEGIRDGIKAGRAISAKNESELRAAHAAIGNVLASLGDEENDQEGKASGTPEAKPGAGDEDPAAGKSSAEGKEPKAQSPVERLAAQAHLYALTGQEGIQS